MHIFGEQEAKEVKKVKKHTKYLIGLFLAQLVFVYFYGIYKIITEII